MQRMIVSGKLHKKLVISVASKIGTGWLEQRKARGLFIIYPFVLLGF